MELFKITCVTCKAKLSVRNREIIGQIVACPSCDSMVQVEAPAAATGAAAVAEPPVPTQSAVEQPVQPSDFADAAMEPAPTTVEPEQTPAENISLPTAASMAKYRLVAWTLASFVVGAAVGGVALLLRDDSDTANVSQAEVSAQPEAVAIVSQVETPAEPARDTADSADTVEPRLIESPTLEDEVDADGLDMEDAIEATEIARAQTQPPAEPPNESAAVDKPAVPQVASRFDALDLDPESLDLETLKSASQEAPGNVNIEDPTAPSQALPSEEPQPAHAATLPAVRRDPQQEQPEPLLSAEELLEQRFQSLSVKAMPISDLMSLVSRLGGVPISVAPNQLQMAGITSRRSVSLDTKDKSLADALRSVLEPLNLEYQTAGSQVVIVRQDADRVRKIQYPLEDLLNAATSLEDILGWIEQLVVPSVMPTLAENVQLDTAENTLSIEQSEQLQYQVLIFLERLRLARGIPTRSRFPVKRLASSAPNAALAARLQSPTTFTFSHYTPLSEVSRYWQQELGIPILVDWPALESLGVWPNSRIACAAEGQSWAESLDQVLDPLGLAWRTVAGDAVQITSAENVQTELQLELYQLEQPLGNQTEGVLDQLRSIAAEQPAEIAYDPTGKVLLVLQPATAQRRIFQWLVDNRHVAND